MKLEERLVIAADFNPRKIGGHAAVAAAVLDFATQLEGSGIYIKLNSVLRSYGYELIDQLHTKGLKVFADLKLNDISNTLETDAELLAEHKPEIVTVMCSTGVSGMSVVQKILTKTEVLGVTVLTSFDDKDCKDVFACSSGEGVVRLASLAQSAGLKGLVLSAKEISLVEKHFPRIFNFNTPGIRPEWSLVDGDDQSRVLTPAQAIAHGADRIVIGRPISQAPDPREAVLRTLEEIEEGLKNRLRVVT